MGMFLAGPVSQGDNHDTKIAPFQIYVLKLINDPEGKVSLKIRDPTGPTFPAGMMAGLQTQLISTLSHKTGVNGGLSHGSVRQRYVKGECNVHGLKGMSPTAAAKDVPAGCIPQMVEQGENSFHHSCTIPSLGNFITCHLLDPHKAK